MLRHSPQSSLLFLDESGVLSTKMEIEKDLFPECRELRLASSTSINAISPQENHNGPPLFATLYLDQIGKRNTLQGGRR